MNTSIRSLSLTAAALLTLSALSGCSGAPEKQEPVDEGAAVEQAVDQQQDDGDTEQVGDDEDQGSVTLTLTGGEHAGEYTGTGSLKCGYGDFIPDSWWVVFAGDADDAQHVNIANFWLADDAHVDDEESPYQGVEFTADAWLGNPYLDGAKFAANAEDGGSLEVAEAAGNHVTFTGTWSDGTGYTLVAECPRVKTS